MDFDQMTEDQLRAVVDTGKQAEQELSRRWTREAEAVEARVNRVLRGDASAAFKPNDLRFAAYQRCACGAGMAYPIGCGTKGAWHCSAILRGAASRERVHSGPQSFQFCEIKGENQPSANGATTRDEPKGGEQ